MFLFGDDAIDSFYWQRFVLFVLPATPSQSICSVTTFAGRELTKDAHAQNSKAVLLAHLAEMVGVEHHRASLHASLGRPVDFHDKTDAAVDIFQ